MMMRRLPAAALSAALSISAAAAHDDGQWGDKSPRIRAWFQSVMVPDAVHESGLSNAESCCGRGDAMRVRMDGDDPATHDMFVVVTDGNGVMPDGARVRVPRAAIQTKYGNPLGEVILFVSGGVPICLIPQEGT